MSRLKVSALAPTLVAGFALMTATGFAKDRAPKPIEKPKEEVMLLLREGLKGRGHSARSHTSFAS